MTQYNKNWITWFNKNKTKELYDEVSIQDILIKIKELENDK